MQVPYIAGNSAPTQLPLGRFLPPIPAGMVEKWCQANLKPDDWVLDPFGFSPMTIIEIASAGHPILAAVNNPIQAFLVKIIASAPQQGELVAALQDLAVSTKGDDRMEPYIRGLYEVKCANCQRTVEADSFLWKKGEEHPFAAQVACPFCGANDEQILTDDAQESLSQLPPMRLHQARALNRIADVDDPLREQVENALNTYPIRPLIILQTIINKLENLEQSPRRRDLLTALILAAADRGNTLWAHPTPRERPRQIVIPSIFAERNLWKVMEEAINAWQIVKSPIPVRDWGDTAQPAEGIYLFEGRFKEIDPMPEENLFSAVIAGIPRPNQAFWTLSALWTGWIWGKEAVTPIRQVLSRQRYDWNWHTNALRSVFEAVHTFYHPQIKFWGLIAENEPLLLLATLLAADNSGWQLTKYAQSTDDQIAQCAWQPSDPNKPTLLPSQAINLAQKSVEDFLLQKAEPAAFQLVHAAAVTGLAYHNNLAMDIFIQNRNQACSETQKWLETLFQIPNLLTRVAGGTASLDSGIWFLENPEGAEMPLIDQIEIEIIRHLIDNNTTSAQQIRQCCNAAFPGLLTPEDVGLLNCLESYADCIDPEEHLWQLRDTETPEKRREDIRAIRISLAKIGDKLHYRVEEGDPMLWYQNQSPIPDYSFHIFASAAVSQHLRKSSTDATTKLLVIPGSRANLLAFKRERDPLLVKRLDRDFLIVKFRLVRDLEVNPLLSRELFKEQIIVDPPEYRSSQLALF